MRSIGRGVGVAVHLVRDVGYLATHRPEGGGSRSVGRLVGDLGSYLRALRAAERGDVAAAVARAEPLLADHPDLWGALLITSASSSRRGEPSAALAATKRLRGLGDTALLRHRQAVLEARLLETDGTWLPEIAGPASRPGSATRSEPGAIEPRARNVILHLLKASLPDRQSGYTIRSRETLRAQVEAGLEPFVVTPYGYPPPGARRGVPEVEDVDGIRHFRLAPGANLAELSDTEQLSRTATLAAAVIQRERPAIVHVASGNRGSEYALVAAALKARLGLPFVYEVRGFLEASWTSDERAGPYAASAELTRRRLATELRLMTLAAGVTTLGSAMRDELVERGVPAEKIVIVPNGIDPEAFRPIEPDPGLRRRYGLGDRWVFGYISNMDHFREGHALLIEATARLVADGRNVACLLVGDGTLRRQLEAQVAAAGLGSVVVFTGQVPHELVQAHYALLDAFVVARRVDRAAQFTTPLKPYEAMAMGIPLVVSDLPALTEIAARDERGLVFPVDDAGALAAALTRLMDQPDLGPRLAEAARRWVVAERTWRANGPRYRDLYAAITDRQPAPGARRTG